MDEQAHNPYATPAAALVTQPAAVEPMELAGRMTRLGAVLIDGLIGMFLVAPVMYLTGFWGRAMAQQVSIGESILWAVGGFIGFIAIHAYPLHRYGQTWGKRALGIRIVDVDGNKPDLVRLVGMRYLPFHALAQVPIAGPLFGLVNHLMIFRADRRCLHDLVAGTRVVKGNPVLPEGS